MVSGFVKAVCISEKKGEQKRNVGQAEFQVNFGITGDAHGGDWHRQVSLISYEKVKAFNAHGGNADHGAFGENLVVEGIDFKAFPIGTRFICGDVILELTQIGKECHTPCQIYHKMGDCIMPREGVFAKVLHGGVIAAGDRMEVRPASRFTAAVITVSDTGARGGRKDESGPIIKQMLEAAAYQVTHTLILPDEQTQITEALCTLCDDHGVQLILTTGGTGFSKRDRTPEATMAVAERVASGIAEAIRAHSLRITGRAMLSRGVSVIRGDTLIINLPGSPKAAGESLEYILPHIAHGIEILSGTTKECART